MALSQSPSERNPDTPEKGIVVDFSETANVPTTVTLGGTEIQIAELTMCQIFGDLEQEVKRQYMRDVREGATGLDKATYSNVIAEALKNIPKGIELANATEEFIDTWAGKVFVVHLGTVAAGVPVSQADLRDLFKKESDPKMVGHAINKLFGIEPEEEGKKKAQVPST